MKRLVELHPLLQVGLYAILIVLGLVACWTSSSWLGLWILVGVPAAIWHLRSKRYWVASIGATVLGAVVTEAILVLGILMFDPFFTGWREVAAFFVRDLPLLLIMGLPIALIIGLVCRRSRRLPHASA